LNIVISSKTYRYSDSI